MHAVTGLLHCIDYVGRHRSNPGHRREALDYARPFLELSRWTEDLKPWRLKNILGAAEAEDTDELYRQLILALPGAIAEWLGLGSPDTREKWQEIRLEIEEVEQQRREKE